MSLSCQDWEYQQSLAIDKQKEDERLKQEKQMEALRLQEEERVRREHQETDRKKQFIQLTKERASTLPLEPAKGTFPFS